MGITFVFSISFFFFLRKNRFHFIVCQVSGKCSAGGKITCLILELHINFEFGLGGFTVLKELLLFYVFQAFSLLIHWNFLYCSGFSFCQCASLFICMSMCANACLGASLWKIACSFWFNVQCDSVLQNMKPC